MKQEEKTAKRRALSRAIQDAAIAEIDATGTITIQGVAERAGCSTGRVFMDGHNKESLIAEAIYNYLLAIEKPEQLTPRWARLTFQYAPKVQKAIELAGAQLGMALDDWIVYLARTALAMGPQNFQQ